MGYRNLPIVDAHIHVHMNSDNTVRPTLQRQEQILQDIFEKTGDEAIVLLACSYGGTSTFGKAGKIILMDTPLSFYLKEKCPRKIYNFAAISHHHLQPEKNTQQFFLEQVKFRYAAGCDGFKSLDGLLNVYKDQKCRLSDPSLDLMYAFLEENQIPLLMHVGGPMEVYEKGSIIYSDDPELARPEELYEDVTALLEKFPKLTLILAHFNFMSRNLEKAEYMLSKWENLYFDLTPNIFMYWDFNKLPDETVRGFFRRNCHKILYGTDTFIEEGIRPVPLQVELVRDYFEKEASDFLAEHQVRPLPMEDEVLRKMYRENVMRLLPAQPRPVSGAHVVEECQQLLTYETLLNKHDIQLLRQMIAYFQYKEDER